MSAANAVSLDLPTEKPRTRKSSPPWGGRESSLLLQVVFAISAVAALAVWDEAREARQAVEDLAEQQSALASSVAASLQLRVELLRRDAQVIADALDSGRPAPMSELRDGPELRVEAGSIATPSAAVDHGAWEVRMPAGPNRHLVLRMNTNKMLPPGALAETTLLKLDPSVAANASDPAATASAALMRAVWTGARSTVLSRSDAARLGLGARTAVAGIARISVGGIGPWAVVTVTSAARERDRGTRARWRLLISVSVIASVVSIFARTIMSIHRREILLEREVARSVIERERIEHLRLETRAATMLTLAAGVAHEVGTPLGVIMGRAEQISDRTPAEDRTRRNAEQIVEQAKRIKAIVDGLMTVARTGTPVPSTVAPVEVLRRAAEAVEWRFAKDGVTLACQFDEGLPDIRGEGRLLEHAVVNLLLNACKASTRGATVRLVSRRERTHLVIEVLDEGIGIDPSIAARVLEPFFTTRPADGGTGVGLAITNEIVQMHRGVLALAPNSPRGTRAELRLPLSEEVAHGA